MCAILLEKGDKNDNEAHRQKQQRYTHDNNDNGTEKGSTNGKYSNFQLSSPQCGVTFGTCTN